MQALDGRKKLLGGLLTALLTLPIALLAQDDPRGEPEESDALGTIRLDPMEVRGRKEELALRMIKLAYERKPSKRAEDLDKVVCWVDNATGSHLNYLYCGTNRALHRMNAAGRGTLHELIRTYHDPRIGGPREPMTAPPGTNNMIFRSDQAVTRGQIKHVMQKLGPSEVNREILERVSAGEPMPDNLPDESEIASFLTAYRDVRQTRARYDERLSQAAAGERAALQAEADTRMMEEIREAGLGIDRYNEIAELSERYESLRRHLATRLSNND